MASAGWSRIYFDVIAGDGERLSLESFTSRWFSGLDRLGVRRDYVTVQRPNGERFNYSTWLFAPGHLRFAKRVQNPASDIAETLEPSR